MTGAYFYIFEVNRLKNRVSAFADINKGISGGHSFPATPNQNRYVKSELTGAGSYMIPLGHVVQGALDLDALKQAAAQLVARHDALRTSFRLSDGVVSAEISAKPHFQFHHCSLTDDSLSAFRAWALPLVFDRVDPRVPGALIRILVADLGSQWRFTIAAHHATTDGFSRGVMTKELLKLYAGETLAPAQSYYNPALSAVADPVDIAQVDALVKALPKPVRMIGDGVDAEGEASAGHVMERKFADLSKPLRKSVKSLGLTRFGLFSAVYALGLCGATGASRVSSFFQTEGRKVMGAGTSVVGPYSNTLPLDLSVDLDRDFAGFVQVIAARVQHVITLERAPVLDAVLAADKGPSVSINMFPPAAKVSAGDLEVGPREFLDRRTEFDLNLVWAEDRGVLSARAFYDKAHLSDARVGLFLDQQARLLEAVLADPTASCREILSRARAAAPAILPQAKADSAPLTRLHTAFFEWVKKTPEATALVTLDQQISYRELSDRMFARLAGLQSAGVTPEDCVVIYAARGPELVEAMLAVSASGASFAIVDETYPRARVERMLARLAARFVIEAGAQLPKGLRGGVTFVTPLTAPLETPRIINGAPRAIAYHMFTSGTTGEPKLISHPDETLQRFVRWQSEKMALETPIVTMMMAGLGHDPTLRDVFLPLSHGGAVAVPSATDMQDPATLRALMTAARCNVVRLSPASGRLLSTGAASGHMFDDLRGVFWGGERLPQAVVQEWRHRLPAHARQFNIFGTTETPQAFLFHEIHVDAPPARDIPLGQVLPWTGARVLAEDGMPVAHGEVGELVADLADPIQGAHDPFAAFEGGVKRHFTGDLAYMMPSGDVTFVGRRDGQIKLNGYRVELGEIEAYSEAVNGVKQAKALVFEDRLLLFVLSCAKDTPRALKAHLAQNVPSYMVPAQIVALPQFPATPNGKVDTGALIALARQERSIENLPEDTPLSGQAEMLIAQTFARFSGRKVAGRSQSLSDLGVDSIGVIEARLELEAAGVTLPDAWQWLPISELAALQPQEQALSAPVKSLLGMGRIDTFVLVRAVAIIAVVAFHNGIHVPLGASIILFVLAGFSFAKLQLPAILREDHAGRVASLLTALMVPMVAISLIYFAKHTFVDNTSHLSTILPYRNLADFYEFSVLERDPYPIELFWLWFLHAYLQMFLFIGFLLCFSRIRAALRADMWAAMVVFFCLTEAVGVGTILALAAWTGDFDQTSTYLLSWPTTLLPFLAIGAVFACAHSTRRVVITLGLGVLHCAVAALFYHSHGENWWLLALALCIFVPHTKMPRIVVSIVVVLAVHSLIIYLSQHGSGSLFIGLMGAGEYPVAMMVFQLCFGVALGMVMRPLLDRLGVRRLAGVPFSFGRQSLHQKMS